MNSSVLVIYDDDHGRLGPVTVLQAVFQVRTGAMTTLDRLRSGLGRPPTRLWTPKRRVGVVKQAYPDLAVNEELIAPGAWLVVNGRWSGLRLIEQVQALTLHQAVVQSDGQVVAALLDGPQAMTFLQSGCQHLPDHVHTLRIHDRALIERPWHILDELPATLLADLQTSDLPVWRMGSQAHVTAIGEHPVRVGQGVCLMPGVVMDTRQGPVVIDEGAVVQPQVVLHGPCYVGKKSTLTSHACIRANTVIGPGCKVGGEVSASILQAYSNKSHAGFLGDSLVGSWVNLGADTSTSNLKNTYGPVRVRLDEHGPEEDTGRTFLGAIIGDYVRTAIGTRLPTGAVIYPGCMLAGDVWAPKFAGPLGFYTERGREPYDLTKLIQTLRAMMQRRGVPLTDEQAGQVCSLIEGSV